MITACESCEPIIRAQQTYRPQLTALPREQPELYAQVDEAIAARQSRLAQSAQAPGSGVKADLAQFAREPSRGLQERVRGWSKTRRARRSSSDKPATSRRLDALAGPPLNRTTVRQSANRPMPSLRLPGKLTRARRAREQRSLPPTARGSAAIAAACPAATTTRIECAHVCSGTDGGIALKPSDRFCIGRRAHRHAEQYRIGEAAFEPPGIKGSARGRA